MNFDSFLFQFNRTLEGIVTDTNDEYNRAHIAISYINEQLNILSNWLVQNTFQSNEEEIHFFKKFRPQIVSQLIYYQTIVKIIVYLPTATNAQLKHYKSESNKILKFEKKHRDFIAYYKSRASHFDRIYFVRNEDKNIVINDAFVINFDTKICTSHDYIVAQYLANQKVLDYLKIKIDNTTNHNTITPSNLNWTGKKIDLVELIYALAKSKAINNGNSDIQEIAQALCSTFNTSLGDNIARSFIDIKNRKENYTRFIDHLKETLNDSLDTY